jgi:hypothetical protein
MKAKIDTSATMLLKRLHIDEPWTLEWPKRIQLAAFSSLTKDELKRFPDLAKNLENRVGVIHVTLTLKEDDDA